MVPRIVYIGASWCGTCKVIKPDTERLGRLYGVEVITLDYDELESEEQETITKVPTIRIIGDNGDRIAEYNVNQVASLTAWLQGNIKVNMSDDF